MMRVDTHMQELPMKNVTLLYTMNLLHYLEPIANSMPVNLEEPCHQNILAVFLSFLFSFFFRSGQVYDPT